MSDIHEGGCLCGAVRYRAKSAALETTHCHCEMCRRHGGTVFQTWVTFATNDFAFVSGRPAIYASSKDAERGHCRDCGTPLLFRYHAHPGRTSVTVGSLDRPETVTPSVHNWVLEKISWLRLDKDLARNSHS